MLPRQTTLVTLPGPDAGAEMTGRICTHSVESGDTREVRAALQMLAGLPSLLRRRGLSPVAQTTDNRTEARTMTPPDAALGWIKRGFLPVPIPFRSKRPVIERWPALRITRADVPRYFDAQPQNISPQRLGTPALQRRIGGGERPWYRLSGDVRRRK
jgi:hypothetical protein